MYIIIQALQNLSFTPMCSQFAKKGFDDPLCLDSSTQQQSIVQSMLQHIRRGNPKFPDTLSLQLSVCKGSTQNSMLELSRISIEKRCKQSLSVQRMQNCHGFQISLFKKATFCINIIFLWSIPWSFQKVKSLKGVESNIDPK